MNQTDRTARRWMLVCAVLLALTNHTQAQEAVGSQPSAPLPAPLLRKPSTTLSAPSDQKGPFFQFGPFSLHPRLTSRTVYALGLPAPDGRHVASMIYTQAPGLRLDIGQSWTFDYNPTWVNYTARSMNDKLDHSASLQGAWKWDDWALQFSESYSIAAPILLETGQQTPQRTWGTQLGVTRKLASRLSLQNMTSLDERYGSSFPSTREWTTMNWLTLQFSSRTQIGLGLGGGYSDISRQPDDTSLRYMGRLNWRPTDKLSLALDGGVESRKSRAAAAKKQQNPIVTASLGYQPFEVTQFTLSSTRTVASSYFQNQITKGKGWDAGLQQRLLGHFYLRLGYSHQQSDYTALVPVVILSPPAVDPQHPISLPGRSDQVDALNLRFSTQLFQRLTLACTYQSTANTSNQANYTFDSTQYGFELSYRF